MTGTETGAAAGGAPAYEPDASELHAHAVTAQPTSRLAWLDSYRGVAIVAVVLIHVLGRFMHATPPGSKRWFLMAVIHRASHFAVPGFLLLSAALNTASLLRRRDLRNYFASRALSVLWPYLLWSAVYLLVTHWQQPIAVPWRAAPSLILWGKAYHHLYFMWVLLQLLLVLPLAALIARRSPRWWPIALVTAAVTLAVYAANRYAVHDPNFSRSLLWYVPSVSAGFWLGSRMDRLRERLRGAAPYAAVATCAGFLLYGTLALRAQLGQPINTFLYQMGEWVYTAAAGVLLLYVCSRPPRAGLGRWLLDTLGRYSLPIYLVHPLLFLFLDRWPQLSAHAGAGAIFLYVATALFVPTVLGTALDRAGIYSFLFGRTASPGRS